MMNTEKTTNNGGLIVSSTVVVAEAEEGPEEDSDQAIHVEAMVNKEASDEEMEDTLVDIIKDAEDSREDLDNSRRNASSVDDKDVGLRSIRRMIKRQRTENTARQHNIMGTQSTEMTTKPSCQTMRELTVLMQAAMTIPDLINTLQT